MICFPFRQEKKLCSGCGACAQACLRRALTMEPDDEGFLYPVLDEEKCVRCGACDAVCPMISGNHQENANARSSAYIVKVKDRKIGLNCATVGLCTWIGMDCVHDKGVVFGVVLDESSRKACHARADNADMVRKMSNSKYLQSDTRYTYSEVKSLLNDGKNVLYVGTPCQIAGLKAFLRKPYGQLLTIDVVCHGVFSPKLQALEVGYWENLFKGKLSGFRFRSKRFFPWFMGAVVNFDMTGPKGKTRHVERHFKSSPTYRCFAPGGDGLSYNIRLSCYSCPFRGKGRYGDLTVGDAWGLNNEFPRIFTPRDMIYGIGLLLCNTEKGAAVVDKLGSSYNLHRIPVESAFAQPALLEACRPVPAERKAIYEGRMPYGQLVERLTGVRLEREYRKVWWQAFKTRVKFAIKEIFWIMRTREERI